MSAAPTTDGAVADIGPHPLAYMAAVRLTFHPKELLEDWLADFSDASLDDRRMANDALFDLMEEAVPMMDEAGQPALTLPDSERLALLKALGAPAAARLLADIPTQQLSATERMLMDWLAGKPIEPSLDNAQLCTMQTVSRWAAALGLSATPAPEEVDARLRHRNFLQGLGGSDLDSFVGRKEILQQLHSCWQQTRELNCVAIEGPGGIGKSLTLTHFIAGLLEGSTEERPDAVYHLDFDSLTLQQARPATIWRELIRQSRAWCDPDKVDALGELAHMVRSGGAGVEMASDSSRSSQHDDMSQVAIGLLHIIGRQRVPRIIVFVDSYEQVDGFDDVAAASPEQVARILAHFDSRILLIYASRTFKHLDMDRKTHLVLGQFTEQEAAIYLKEQAALAGIEITDDEVLAVQVAAGRSPLGLRLAVALLQKGDLIDGTVPWHAQIERSPEFVQAALYERLLRRIRDVELRKVAAPGLLVRRLTEDLIREVLTGPCELNLDSETPARLMAAAEREGQLFFRRDADPHALWHRQDVRATMLENVRRLAGDEVATQIHQAAVAYYMHDSSMAARTEELYHRLCLNQDKQLLDSRWEKNAGLALRSAIDELPAAAQAYLRARFGAATDKAAPEVNASAMDYEAEFDLLTRKRLLADGPTETVLKRWDAAGHRLNGIGGDLLAATLVQTGQHDVMLAGAERMFDTHPENLLHKSAAGVLRISGAVLEGRKQLADAVKHWAEAVMQAKWAADELGELAGLVGQVRVARKLAGNAGTADDERHRALRLLERLSPGLNDHKVLAREAGAELGTPTANGGGAGHVPPALVKLIEGVIASNEAFPSLASGQERIAVLSERFLGSRSNVSIRNLNSVALRSLRSPQLIGMLLDTLREEVDWTLTRGAWPPSRSAADELPPLAV